MKHPHRKASLSIAFAIVVFALGAVLLNGNWKRPQPMAVNDKEFPTGQHADSVSSANQPDAATRVRVNEAFGKMPLYFIENRGQLDSRVAFYADGADKTLYFTSEGITFELISREKKTEREAKFHPASYKRDPDRDREESVKFQRYIVKLDFVGANPDVTPIPQAPASAVISYFKSSPEQWKTGLRTYGMLLYPDLWPGIDLVVNGETNQLKYNFVVKPGADPNKIKLAYRGATSVKINKEGQLKIATPFGSLSDDKPVSYQQIDGCRVEISSGYELVRQRDLNRYVYGFSVGNYDKNQPLVIDPVMLIYCGYIGGSREDYGYGIAVDSSGNAYVTGYTVSNTSTNGFPATVGPDIGYNGNQEAFVAKVRADGTGLVYCGYIGGSSVDIGHGIAVDSNGNAYVTGYTDSSNFPVTVGPDIELNTGYDAFIAKVRADGTSLVYCGYIGGSGSDYGYGIAVDSGGNAYVTGYTSSTDGFPATAGLDTSYNGGAYDAFVAKVRADGTGLVYCGYIGGSGRDYGYGIAVDGSGNAYIAGETWSATGFPVAIGPDTVFNGGNSDAFVAKVRADGVGLAYCGFIGGLSHEGGNGIAIDSSGNAYVTGYTWSSPTNGFPVTVGPYTVFKGGTDAFVAKVRADGTGLVYCGYIGGSDFDSGNGIAVDSSGNAYVTGDTGSNSPTDGFPAVVGPDTSYNGGFNDAFVAKVKADGTGLVYCGYIGGSGSDYGYGIAIDSSGNAYVIGETTSDASTAGFPATVGPDVSFNGSNGLSDAFVAKINPTTPVANAGTDQTTRVGNNVTLNGSVSSGVPPLAYAWSFTGKPSGSTAILNGANTVAPTFTPDREGVYTIKLIVSAGGQSATDTMLVQAVAQSCNSSSLSIFPVSLTVGKNQTRVISGFGGSRNYTWGLVANASGGSLSATSGPAVSYTSGNNNGQDVIRMTDPWCGTKDLQVTVSAPEVGRLIVPATVFQGDGLNVSATFIQPVSQARACVYQINSAPIRCQFMNLDSDGMTYKTTFTTGDLVGTYTVGVSGSNGSYGTTREAKTNIAQSRPPILLLNGYDFDGKDTDKHYLQWRQFPSGSTSIECQLQQLYGSSQSCATQNITNCDPNDPAHDMVCVVDKLNGRKDIDFNKAQLSQYIEARPWLSSAKKLILIGHSYGGQISLAYAVDNPSKVQSIFTLDTPHLGGLPGFVEAQKKIALGPDDAIYFFTPSGASKLNGQISPKKILNSHIYLVSSERLQRSLVAFAKHFIPFISTNLRVETDADDIVPVPSQRGEVGLNILGGAYFGYGFNGTNVTRADKFQTTYIGGIFNTLDNLHNAVIEKPDLWGKLYEKFKAYLSQEVIATAQGSLSPVALLKHTSTSELSLNPPLPAAYPLQLVKVASGTSTVSSPNSTVSFVVEAGQDLTISLDSKNFNPKLALSGPGGITYTATTVNGLNSHYQVSQGFDTITQSFLILAPAAGNWSLSIEAPNGGSGPNLPNSGASWEVNVLVRSPISFQGELAESAYITGESLNVKTIAKQDASAMTGLTVTASITPNGGGTVINFTLFDDGAHDDGVAGDGVYGGTQTLSGTGVFDLAIATSGTSNLGSFQRQQIGSFTVAIAESTLSGGFTESAPDANADGQYDSLNWNFNINVPRSGGYTVSGDLTDKNGTTIASTSVQIKASSAGVQPVTLTFLGQDIYASGREGPYTLKNLRIIVTTNEGEFLSGRPAETATTGGPYWSWLLFERAQIPLVKWLTPTSEYVIRSGSFELKWAVEDGNGGATIDLYYDTTGSGFAGTLIVAGLEAVNGEMSYNWNLSSLPDGLYYIYARVRNGDFSNALYGGSVRKLTDTDNDGMPDAWETAHGLNPNSAVDAYLDPDSDLLTNLDEYLNNTNPQAADTDGGGEKDGSELLNGRDPLTASDDATGITLLAVNPGQGDSRGGDQVMVLGSGFQNGATVSFGGVAAPSVTFINSTKLLVTTPAHTVGLTNVTVTNPASGGSVTKTDAFNFLFQFIEPPIAGNNGPICAGATLNVVASTISGATYSWTGPNGFTSSQQNPSIPSATTAASGTYTVTVTIPGYTFPPVTTNVVVNPIPAAPTITAPSSVLTGSTGLVASVANHAGAFYNWTITNGAITAGQGTNQITFTAGTAGTLMLQVVETNSSGCRSGMASANVPILNLRIDSVAPAAGRTSGGQQIRLTGSFANLLSVMVGGVSATWNYSNGTSEITVTTPPHAAGAVNIDLTPTSGSPYSKNNAFAYLPTTFTDNTLVVGVTTAKAQHIIELRQAVDALRAVAGLGLAPWTDPTLTPFNTSIKAVHILELRTYLDDAAARLGYSAGAYTDPALSSGFVIKRVHIEELRQRIRALAG